MEYENVDKCIKLERLNVCYNHEINEMTPQQVRYCKKEVL